jgi:hypothetical protein
MHNVSHLDASLCGHKLVAVMPEGIGAKALFIYKKVRRLSLGRTM